MSALKLLYSFAPFSQSSDNLIVDNRFLDNDVNAKDDGTGNAWDDGTIGNSWDDGIGDTHHELAGDANAKDTRPIFQDGPDPPQLNALSPTSGGLYGEKPPSFAITVTDASLSAKWYKLYDGTNWTKSCLFEANGTIDQECWDELSDGSITLRFHANDTLGNVN